MRTNIQHLSCFWNALNDFFVVKNQINRQSIAEYRRFAKNSVELKRRNLERHIQSLQKNLSNLKSQVNDYQQLLEISDGQLRQGNISMIDYLTLLSGFIDLKELQINFAMDIRKIQPW